MGWKTVKERFEIAHIVSVSDGRIHIGTRMSPYIASINPDTGRLTEKDSFTGFLERHCPTLKEASRASIINAMDAEDTFRDSIPVYTFDGDEIIEKRCEKLEFPNVTHDGDIMWEGRYSPGLVQVVAWAKREALAREEMARRDIHRLTVQVSALEKELADSNDAMSRLCGEYPDIPPSV